jgi:hypothetical protein
VRTTITEEETTVSPIANDHLCTADRVPITSIFDTLLPTRDRQPIAEVPPAESDHARRRSPAGSRERRLIVNSSFGGGEPVEISRDFLSRRYTSYLPSTGFVQFDRPAIRRSTTSLSQAIKTDSDSKRCWCEATLTVITGTGDSRTTRSATLPRKK